MEKDIRLEGTGGFQNFLHHLDRHVLNPESRKEYINVLYGIFACLMLLHHVYVTLYRYTVISGADTFTIPWILFAVMNIFLGKMWKDKCFWILLALLLLQFFRISAADEASIAWRNKIFSLGIYAYFGCYGIGHVLQGEKLKRFIWFLCLLWTAAMVVYSCIGIYVGSTGTPVSTLGGAQFCITEDNRLRPVYHPVDGGIIASAGIAVAIAGMCITRNKAGKAGYLLSIIVIFTAGVMTATRTFLIVNASEFAIAVTLFFYNLFFSKTMQKDREKKAIKWIALIAIFTAVLAGMIFLQPRVFSIYEYLTGKRSFPVSAAYAEEGIPAAEPRVSFREFKTDGGMDSFLNGRYRIWENAFTLFREEPKVLLWGESAFRPMEKINKMRNEMGLHTVSHVHNTFLQIMLENGIPGLLLYLSFIFIFIWQALKLMLDPTIPLWQKIMPVPAIGCLIADTVDVCAIATDGYPPMTILYLFIGLTTAFYNAARKKANQSRDSEGIIAEG